MSRPYRVPNEIPPFLTESINDSAERLRADFSDGDPWLFVPEAANKIGVSESALCVWIREHKLPVGFFGRKYQIKQSVCDEISSLRTEHGHAWHQHTSWPRSGVVSTNLQDESQQNDSLDMQLRFFSRLVRRARDLKNKGETALATELLFSAIEELDLFEGVMEDPR